ncbi:AmmeMemoRadiSam system protein A [Desulfovibrio inopinatus]|uniref:AmmeMemoRadiSam system protein A n=1 Tax=Desulfovibrio inopinatus TaxID=102109 RepID=UPI000402F238|nr:AmmeMemoRadiSam system protein A [Desulfovibrio inopinatus]
MDTAFRFSLTEEEKECLKTLVRYSISEKLSPTGTPVPPPVSDKLQEKFGAFVTLKREGRLRGCIGHLVGDEPLYATVFEMARQAAFGDPRFPPLSAAEFDDLNIEISILGPITVCPDPKQIEIGRHGLIIRKGPYSGLLLPQVAVEWKWDQLTFLQQTCRKAGLPPEAWKDPDTQLFWFEAEVF